MHPLFCVGLPQHSQHAALRSQGSALQSQVLQEIVVVVPAVVVVSQQAKSTHKSEQVLLQSSTAQVSMVVDVFCADVPLLIILIKFYTH